MLVTEVRKITNKKCRISLGDGTSFVLYPAEVRRYHIAEREELGEETLRQITDEILKKRACLRCMNLLKTSDRTVKQLRDTLVRDGHPDGVIRHALDYVASYHYTDDRRYAENYIRRMSGRKSLKQIEYELMKRGVDREVVRASLMEADAGEAGDPEREAIRSIVRKRGYDPAGSDQNERARLYRYLMGKGFGYEAVRAVLASPESPDSDGRRG